MPQAPLEISIALCTYNSEAFLREQLDSFLRQTWSANEIVVVDDGSQDGTIAILKEYESKLPLRIHGNDSNLGFVKSFEKALSLCSGKVIFPSDHDDIWHQEKLEKCTRPFLTDPELMITFCNAELVDSGGQSLSKNFWSEIHFSLPEREAISKGRAPEVLLRKAVAAGNSIAIKDSLLRQALPIPAGWAHDEWIMALGAFSGKILPIEERLLSYRQHNRQVIGVAHSDLASKIGARIKRASNRNASDFAKDFRKWQALGERLGQQNSGPYANMLRRKIRLQAYFAEYPANRLLRLPMVIWAWLKGDYSRFGNGWATALRDWLT